MVYFAKPEAPKKERPGAKRSPLQQKKPSAGAAQTKQLARAEKEGRDNTRILQRALAEASSSSVGAPSRSHHQPQQQQLPARESSHYEAGPAFPRAASVSAEESQAWLQQQSQLWQQFQQWQRQSQQLEEQQSQHMEQQQQQPRPGAVSPQQHPAMPGRNFMQRNIQRLGGQGVASLLTDASASSTNPGHKAAGFMSALTDLKAGLTDDQRQKAAMQREQLKRDLEEQMRAKKEAEAKRKQQLKEQEEREEAELRVYYERQAAAAAAETAGATAASRPGKGGAGGGGGSGGSAGRGPTGASSGQGGITVMVPEKKPSRTSIDVSAGRAGPVQRSPPSVEQVAERQPDAPPTAPQMQAPSSATMLPSLAAPPPQLPPVYSPYVHPLALGQMQMPSYSPFMMMPVAAATTLQAPQLLDGGTSTQLASLLKELQQEQEQLRRQFAAQADTVAHLQNDILLARRERDVARQQLDRVQAQLGQGTAGGVAAAGRVMQHLPERGYDAWGSPGLDLNALSVTTVLPCSTTAIPSRLHTPGVTPLQQASGVGGRGVPGKGAAGLGTRQRAGQGGAAAEQLQASRLPKPGGGMQNSIRKAGTGMPASTAARLGKQGKPRGWA